MRPTYDQLQRMTPEQRQRFHRWATAELVVQGAVILFFAGLILALAFAP